MYRMRFHTTRFYRHMGTRFRDVYTAPIKRPSDANKKKFIEFVPFGKMQILNLSSEMTCLDAFSQHSSKPNKYTNFDLEQKLFFLLNGLKCIFPCQFCTKSIWRSKAFHQGKCCKSKLLFYSLNFSCNGILTCEFDMRILTCELVISNIFLTPAK